jgi:hypothetical protein
MKLVLALMLTLSTPPVVDRPKADRLGPNVTQPVQPAVTRVTDPDFSYLLAHATIEGESPSPLRLPPNSRSSYRIFGVTQQGDCLNGCPPSTIYVVTWNYRDHRDGRIHVFRIDGLRFYDFAGVKSYRPAVTAQTFLTFHVHSNPEPRKRELHEVQVSQDRCTITKLTEERLTDNLDWVATWRRDGRVRP